MRVFPIKKLLVALAAALTLMMAAMASPASAATITGSITIHTTPQEVITIPGDGEGPCQDQLGYTFTATASGTASSGTFEVAFSGKGLFIKPGSSPQVYDQLTFSDIPFGQNVTYTRIGATNNYNVSGTVAMQISVDNLNPTTCAKTSKCVYVLQLDVAGSSHANGGSTLPPVNAGSTSSITATTNTANGVPLTYAGGDCEEYQVLDGVHVSTSLSIVH